MDANRVILLDAIFMSSSSDSDSDEEDIEIYFNLNDNGVRKPRVKNFIENIIHAYENEEFKRHYRMYRSTFYYLLNVIRPYLECDQSPYVISFEKQVYVALYVLGTPDSYRSVVSKFDISNSSAWHAVKRVVKILCQLRNHFIRWPGAEAAKATSRVIEGKYKLQGVLGMMDGTHIRILAPKENAVAYINRKGYHSIQLQVICNEKRQFIHCFAGMPGSVHDMRVFKYSGVQQKCCENNFFNKYIIADSAYTIQKHIMVPYKDNGHLLVDEINYNRILSQSRMVVERSIGLLKGRWRCLLDKLLMRRTDLIPYYIIACCVLHNVCLLCEDEEIDVPIILNEDFENSGPLAITPEQHQDGIIRRDEIKNYLAASVDIL
ncbi:putative nuclease HARBI1 [Prorops nasuta]|uniref:putative nuclease HARBI1 n=1 Tax=Prorops nasuta TaxID=863751 RepID=UPI0034CE867C